MSDEAVNQSPEPAHHLPHPHAPHRTHDVHPNIILGVLALAGVAYSVLSSAVIPALPSFQAALHTSESGTAWLLTAFLLSASVGTSIVGRLGDMYGKEKMLLITLLILAVGTFIAALADSLALLIAARVIQGVAGGIFPLAFSIVRDEFPRDRVAGAIGLLSSILGVGAGVGLVAGALIVEHLGIHWLFWAPLIVTVIAAYATWRWIPESPITSPGKINWIAALLMSAGITLVLIAIAQTTTWGWGSVKTLVLLIAGLLIIGGWVLYEVRSDNPLIDMTMMRIRGVWTTNLAAFLLGAGMYASFLLYPEFAQLPKSTGFGFGASTLVSSLYLLPSALLMAMLGSVTGAVNRRFGSRFALITGSLITAVGFLWMAVNNAHPYDMLISSALLGIGIGLAFSSLGNLIVGAVEPHQTGVASGINTVMRTLGGALGGQIAATFVANHHTAAGIPTVTGFTLSFWMATVFLIVTAGAGTLIPSDRRTKVAVSV